MSDRLAENDALPQLPQTLDAVAAVDRRGRLGLEHIFELHEVSRLRRLRRLAVRGIEIGQRILDRGDVGLRRLLRHRLSCRIDRVIKVASAIVFRDERANVAVCLCCDRLDLSIRLDCRQVKVVFPLEILPVVALGSAGFHLLISLFVWLIFYLIFFGVPQATILLLPVILLPLILMTLGLSWLLASLGVYLRDVSQIIGVFTTVLMFLSPIFYPIVALPEEYRPFMQISP